MSETPPPCDINKTSIISELIKTPRESRDEKWLESFYENVKTASFACGNPQTNHGPDGFPYFELHSPQPGTPFDSFCISNLTDYILQNGLGVVINPSENGADWVFSHGDILNLALNGEFFSPITNPPLAESEVLSASEEVMIAQPSESYLPLQTRSILKSFLTYLGVAEPKMMMIIRKREDSVTQELAFNVFPEDSSNNEEFNFKLQQICWFLPRHYIVVGFSKHTDIAANLAAI